MKRLYHGSIFDLDEIDVRAGKGYKDFGKGFYATAVPSHAEKLALRNKRIEEKRQGVLKNNGGVELQPIIAYRYNLLYNENTSALRIKVFNKANIEWLRFVLQNRKCEESAHDFDIVIGPTADAETTMIVNEYYLELEETGYLDEVCAKVIRALKPENLPKQYFFGTKKALSTLEFDSVRRKIVG